MRACVCVRAHLQLQGLLPAERLQGEAEAVGLGHGAQVEVVLGVDAGRHVDVELQQLQEVPLQLVPVRGRDFLLDYLLVRQPRRRYSSPPLRGLHCSVRGCKMGVA